MDDWGGARRPHRGKCPATDIAVTPGYRLEVLNGAHAGRYNIRVNDFSSAAVHTCARLHVPSLFRCSCAVI